MDQRLPLQNLLNLASLKVRFLGPLLFILYIAPLQDVIATYNLSYMFYADDNQLYIAVNPKETPQVSLDKLRECTQAILHWNTQNMLSTNPGKTEVIHFTSRFQKQPIALDTFKFANTDVTVSDKVRNLGVIMDKNLSFTNHINDMCRKATLAIRSIGRIRKYLPNDGIKRLVNALVMSRLDYSNSLLYGLPKYQIDKLQRLQNTAARLVAGTRRSDHIKPVLNDLERLRMVIGALYTQPLNYGTISLKRSNKQKQYLFSKPD